jgi:protein-tyrosine phosphatase
MSYKADKIVDRLYQGSRPPAGDGLKNAGVDVLVLCAREWQDADAYEGLEVICAPGDDDSRAHRMAKFLPTWKAAARQVVEHVKAGRTVLVTCMAGLNRSGMVTALALTELTNLSGEKIVELVQSRRTDALCNPTFASYIEDNFPGKPDT